MPMSGSLFMTALSKPIDQAINKIDQAPIPFPLKTTARVFGSVIFIFAGSVLLPSVAPLFVLFTAWLIYAVLTPVRENLISIDKEHRYLMIVLPVHALYILWGFVLYKAGNILQLGSSVGPIAVLSTIALWPIYTNIEKQSEKKQKLISYKAVYVIFSAIVLFQQIIIIIGSIK